MKRYIMDLSLRFVFGGLAVAGCYLLLAIIPWKTIAGAFAAFPAVMAAAVIMAGWEKGDQVASNVAAGAVSGMSGGVFCVIGTTIALIHCSSWVEAIIIGQVLWLVSSIVIYKVTDIIKARLHKHNSQENASLQK